ncbi:MAG: hypothetical protein H7Z38_17830 [Rubrivivax sp.]|nr:hypothetical protein [Pyrinomonadaceae bacterium]
MLTRASEARQAGRAGRLGPARFAPSQGAPHARAAETFSRQRALCLCGQPADYAISVNANTTDPATITHTAFLDGFGNTQFLTTPQSEDFKSGTTSHTW